MDYPSVTEQEVNLDKPASHVITRPATLNILIHFCAGEILKTVTQLHTKCIIWFYRVKRDERAHWSVIGKPDRDTVLWTGTKIDMILTEVEYVSLTGGVIWHCMTSDRLHSLLFTLVYLPVRGFIDKAVKSDCVVSLAVSVRRFFEGFGYFTSWISAGWGSVSELRLSSDPTHEQIITVILTSGYF